MKWNEKPQTSLTRSDAVAMLNEIAVQASAAAAQLGGSTPILDIAMRVSDIAATMEAVEELVYTLAKKSSRRTRRNAEKPA